MQAAGVQFFTQSEVLGFETVGGRITSVITTKQHLKGLEIVLASGAWSPQLAKQLNLNIPLQAAKGYSFLVPSLVDKLDIPLLLAEAKVAITPLQSGVRFAGTLEIAGFDLSINERRVNAIRTSPATYAPTLRISDAEMAQQKVWAGLRPLTPDGLPIIGRSPILKNLTIATGHAMMGVSLAPITGKVVSEIISGHKPSIDLTHLTLERF